MVAYTAIFCYKLFMNELKKLKEFQKTLSNYRISEESKKILQGTKLVLLLAPSSSGRNTAIRELLKTGDYYYIVSDTTRQPRINDGIPERDGVEYWFRTEEEVLADLKMGKFLEAEVIHDQQVSGISIRELEKAHDKQKIAITDIEILGVHNIVNAKPDTIPILMLPPSFEEWQRRIHGRGEMAPLEFKRRLETAVRIFEAGLKHDYFKFVINDTIEHTAEQINKLARSPEKPAYHETGRKLANDLCDQTKELLKTL
jgi:guanylate kinase